MRRPLPASRAIIGIVNVTPDSFSDGGAFLDPGRARDHALRLVAEGADALDIGAESTRPGSTAVDPAAEQSRLLPALAAIRAAVDVPILADTRNAATAMASLDAGADGINDVSMLRHDAALVAVAAREGASLVVMHSRDCPATMQRAPDYADVASEVRRELAGALRLALDAGCSPERLIADPGFGFAKGAEHNLELLRRLPELRDLGVPLLVGLSRKAVVGHVLAHDGHPRPLAQRDAGSVGLALAALILGARYLRVHDVALMADVLAGFEAALPQHDAGPSRPDAFPPESLVSHA
jgi:dihydropteroate synthase